MSRKAGVYIYPGSKSDLLGVKKKIKNQLMAFESQYDMREVIIEKKKTGAIGSIVSRLPGGSLELRYCEALRDLDRIDDGADKLYFIYIRVTPPDKKFIGFLKSIRYKYQHARIILELPVYPYIQTFFKSGTMWPWFFKDIVHRGSFRKYVDLVATVSDDPIVFGIPAVMIRNGIDVAGVRPINKDNNDPNTIRLIVVAMMQNYHGYERLINGLATYYDEGGNRKIIVTMVGYGPELEYYKRLAVSKGLGDRVIFKGKLEGDALDEAFEGCDIAVGSLGGYKIGVDKFASIKLGEYLAKGLPVITGAPAYPFYERGEEFNLDFPNDPSDIDMNRVVDFYDGLYKGKLKSDVRKKVRQLALCTVDTSVAMQNVLEYLKESADV